MLSYNSLSAKFSLAAVVITLSAMTFMPALYEYAAGEHGLNFPNTLIEILLFQFLHVGILHLFGNVIFVLIIGQKVEQIIGTDRYLYLFIASMIVIYGLLFITNSPPTVGMSGFAMACLGYLSEVFRKSNNPEKNGIYFFLIINVALGFFSHISLVGHAVGALLGIGYFWMNYYLKGK